MVSVKLRSRSQVGASKRGAAPDNLISFFDQAAFAALRATGRHQLVQGVWIYERPVDIDEIRRFHRNIGHGLFGRLIERSPLPFGRHRWVLGPLPELDIAESARSRAELSDWVDEQAQLPIDPEFGPGWQLAVQPFTDGSTAASLVVSHCLADGGASIVAVFDAVTGNRPDFGYLLPRSRTRRHAVLADAVQTVRGAPEIARTLVATAKLVVQRRHELVRSAAPRPTATAGEDAGDESVVLPSVAVFMDTRDWDARAESLGGNSYSLVAGLTAKLAERVGRQCASDGAVTLLIAIIDRTLGDTRAHAMGIGHASVDPTPVAEDLAGVRAGVKEAIRVVREVPDESLKILPLIPFIPKRAVSGLADVFVGVADLPVSCSNVGNLPPELGRIDSTDADYAFYRGVDQNVTRQQLERGQGQLVVVSSRVGGRIAINVLAYQPGAVNSKAWLREILTRTLAEFGLTGTVL